MSLPRKSPSQTALTKQKQKDVEEFVLGNCLTLEWQLTSKTETARQFIRKVGKAKYGWTNAKYIAQTYIKPVFDEYAESDGYRVWAMFSTYEPLEPEAFDRWRIIRIQEQINEEKAANAFFKMAQGEGIEEELSYYKKALERFKEECGDIPVLLESWRLKTKYWPEEIRSNKDFLNWAVQDKIDF